MPQPPAYAHEFDFGPLAPANVPEAGTRLNDELDRVSETVNAIRDNLALIQRDDGALANRVVSYDTLDTTVRALAGDWTPEGAWLTATAYAVRDLVSKDGVNYICVTAHTSGTFSTDAAAGKWMSQYGDAFTVTGEALVTPNNGATTPVALKNLFADVFRARAFGAVGDGSTDDTAALQAMLDAADAAGGGICELESLEYNHTGLAMSGKSVALVGQGWNTFLGYNAGTRLTYTGSATGDWVTITGDQNVIHSMQLRSDTVLTGGRAINIERTGDAGGFHEVNRVEIKSPFSGIDVLGFSFNIFRDINISAFSGDYGIRFRGTATSTNFYSKLYGVTIDGSATGACVLLEGNVASHTFLDCHFRDAAYGVRFILDSTASTTLRPGLMKFFRCEVESVEGHGFSIEDASFIYITDSYVSICGVGSLGDGIYIGSNINSPVVISGCDIRANGRHGINVAANTNGGRVIVTRSTISNNSQDADNTYSGINFAANCTGFIVANNLIGGDVWSNPDGATLKQRNGVTITAGCEDYIVSGNDLRGNFNSAMFDGGAGQVGQVFGNLGYKTFAQGIATGQTPDGSGDIVIAHDCDAAPQGGSVALLGAAGTARAAVQAVGASTITARLFNTTTGAADTAGTFSVMWSVNATRSVG